MELTPEMILPALKGFERRCAFRAPEVFSFPSHHDTQEFRDFAIRNRISWYPFDSQPPLGDLQTIYDTVQQNTPHLVNIIMMAILEDILCLEGDIYEEYVAPVEIVRFFREKGYTQGRFICEDDAAQYSREDDPRPATSGLPAAEPSSHSYLSPPPSPVAHLSIPSSLPPSFPASPILSALLPPVLPPVAHPQTHLLEKLNTFKEELARLNGRRAQLLMQIANTEASLAAADLGLPRGY